MSEGTKPRHRWVKLAVHRYICLKCGTGKVNAQVSGNYYETTYHTPDGRSRVLKATPPCEPGPKTAVYLAKYATEVEAATLATKAKGKRLLNLPAVSAVLEAFPSEITDVEELDVEEYEGIADGID